MVKLRRESKETDILDFMKACEHGDAMIVEDFLKAGMNPNTSNDYGDTVLHIAVNHNHEKVVELLLEAGADPNKQDSYGNTPLLLVCTKNGNSDIARMLIQAGAKGDIKNMFGVSPKDAVNKLDRKDLTRIIR